MTTVLHSVSNVLWGDAAGGVHFTTPSERLVVIGRGTGLDNGIETSDDDGASWTGRGIPPQNLDICYSPELDRILVAGLFGVTYSDDHGTTWSTLVDINPYYAPGAVAWSSAQMQFIIVGFGYSTYYSVGSTNNFIWSSPDGITWTPRGPALETGGANGVAYSPTLNLWVATDFNGFHYTSPDGHTWTKRTNPFTFGGGALNGVRWFPNAGKFVGYGFDSTFTKSVIESTNGITFTILAGTPFGGIGNSINDMHESGSQWFAGGSDGTHLLMQSGDQGTTWILGVTDADAVPGGGGLKFFETATDLVLCCSGRFPFSTSSPITIQRGPVVPAPVRVGSRFFEGYPWRFIFADIPAPDAPIPSIGGVTTTWANGLLSDRQITKTINQPTTISAAVWPDDIRVNQIFTDGFPVVAQSNRIVYAFRREGGTPPWKIRAAGILMSPEDQGDTDIPLTHFTAYDPWQLLAARPVVDSTGQLPGPYGFSFLAQTGNIIVCTILKNTIQAPPDGGHAAGGFCFIDAGPLYGGTSYWGGTFETTPPVNFMIQQGMSVGDAWTQLCDTGFLDIVLTPIYDPIRRPGYTHELSIYNLSGSEQPSAVMGWDRMNRALTSIDRMHSGVPGDFINKVAYYVGQGGPGAPIQTNGQSIDVYGPYWATQTFPDQTIPSASMTVAFAQQALTLGRQGKRTLTLNPTPERSPIPLVDYDVGDRIPVYASNRLRVTSAGYQRVQVLPITITDDGIEQVQSLLTSPDWREVDLFL